MGNELINVEIDDSIHLYIYYFLSDFVDHDVLEKELEKHKIKVKFEKKELEGIISIKLPYIP